MVQLLPNKVPASEYKSSILNTCINYLWLKNHCLGKFKADAQVRRFNLIIHRGWRSAHRQQFACSRRDVAQCSSSPDKLTRGQGPNIYDVTTPANGIAVAAVGYYNCGSIDGDDERPTEAETNCCGSLRVHEGLPPVPARPPAARATPSPQECGLSILTAAPSGCRGRR